MAACAAQLARQCAVMKPRFERDEPLAPLPHVTPGAQPKHPPRDAARAPLARITGVALVAVTGRSASIAQPLISAVGPDRDQWPTVQPCCSWLGLAPPTESSGGHLWRARTLHVVRRVTPALRQAAPSVARSASACGAYCRARRARLGPQPATGATAPQIARRGSHRLNSRQPFNAESAVTEELKRRKRDLPHRRRRAHPLGYTLTPVAYPCPRRRFLRRPWFGAVGPGDSVSRCERCLPCGLLYRLGRLIASDQCREDPGQIAHASRK
jgi:hypothetical protein